MFLLDFKHCLRKPEYDAYAVFGDPDSVCVIPRELVVYTSAEGIPVFHLEALRGITPFSNPKPYGMLELQLAPREINGDILAEILEEWPAARLFTPDLNSGYLGLRMVASDGEVQSDELETPMELAKMPLSRLRLVKRISIEYVTLIQDALHKGLLLFQGYGITTVKGFAPRVPAVIEFNPGALSKAITEACATAEGTIPLDALINFFNKPVEEIPLNLVHKDESGLEQLGTCLSDWYAARFCTLMPPNADNHEIFFRLKDEASSDGSFTWDLSEPLVTERYSIFTMDALREARDLVMQHGMDSLFHTTVVEPLPTGFMRVEIFHPFYEVPLGIRQIGLKIDALPNPPFRNQAIRETVLFDSGQQKKIVVLHFAPQEEPEYEFVPFAIYGDHTGTREVLGTKGIAGGAELIIKQDHYPFSFRSFSCSRNLVMQASLTLVVKRKDDDESVFEEIVLNQEHPFVILAFPDEEVSGLECQVTAKSLDTADEVLTSLSLLSDLKIDLTSFREYGTHEVMVQMNTMDDQVVGLDLIPEHMEPVASNITTIAFGAGRTETTWSWFSPSIFNAGFRYRFHGDMSGLWSEIQPPFKGTLVLNDQNQPI